MDDSQTPVSKEMWYQGQKYQADAIREVKNDLIDQLDRIEMQTTLHNGRLKKVEEKQAFVQGGITVICIIVVPILVYIIQQLLK